MPNVSLWCGFQFTTIHSGFTQLTTEPPVRLKHENLETIIRNNKGRKIAEYRVEFNLCLTCLNLLLMDTF